MCEEEENSNIMKFRIAICAILLIIATSSNTTELNNFILFLSAYLIIGGDVILKALKHILKGKVFDENFLMGVATLGAIATGEYPEAVMVMLLYQIGEMLQDGAVEKSKKSISTLMDIRPDYANVEINGKLCKKNPEEVNIGDIIKVQAGEKIPLDGLIISGEATVNTSALTGENIPKKLKTGDLAVSGCINTNGLLTIEVKKEFGQSTVSKIFRTCRASCF